jgi:pyridoxal phosphate phosphatase PHOSPHO2
MKLLVVFDFDYTMVDCNSDTEILKKIPELKSEMKKLKSEGVQWTNLVSLILKKASLDHYMTIDELKETISAISISQDLIKLLETLKSNSETVIKIVSDANVFFIQWILEKHQIEHHIDSIISNPCEILELDGKKYLNVTHFDTSTGCESCAINMCKGKIIKTFYPKGFDSLYDFDCIFYVGDGNNDFCPVTKLREKDFIFPRKRYKLLENIENDLKKENPKIISNVSSWDNHGELSENILNSLKISGFF